MTALRAPAEKGVGRFGPPPHGGEPGERSARRVLFVDDEALVLEALKRLLRPMRGELDVSFESDPREALDRMRDEAFDVLVTDMRMPQMDGAELLEQAKELRPGMARIVLSGYSERELTVRSVGLAHQFLAKPCDATTLRATIARACRLRELLADDELAQIIGRLGTLPSLPRLYRAVAEETERDDTSLIRLASLIEQDIAMTAKVLQLVNSDFFASGRKVATMRDAVATLGLDVIRALVVSNAAFSMFDAPELEFHEALWRHSVATGALARLIAARRAPAEARGALEAEALQAGILHDIGQLVIASKWPQAHRQARERARHEPGVDLPAAEVAAVGCDHARVGAYLMGLWGLSDTIVDAIAFHHRPAQRSDAGFCALTAVHVASALVESRDDGLDLDYLAAVGCSAELDRWRADAQRVVTLDTGPPS